MLTYFIRFQSRRTFRYFRTKPLAKIITAWLFLLVFIGVSIGIYTFFYHAFFYINAYPFFRDAVSLYVYELFFLLVSFLVWVGGSIGVLFGLFSNRKQSVVVASPHYEVLAHYSFYSLLVSSLWILACIVVPALLAVSVVFHMTLGAMLLSFLACGGLIVLSVSLSFLSVFFIAKTLSGINKKLLSIPVVVLLQAVLVLGVFIIMGSKFAKQDLIQILTVENLQVTQAPLIPLVHSFSVFPSNATAVALLNAQGGHLALAAREIAWTWIVCFILMGLFVYGTKKWFLSFWQVFSDSPSRKKSVTMSRTGRLRFLWLLRNPFGAIFYKETMVTFRNLRNGFWLLFLSLLWLSHVGANSLFQKNLNRYHYDIPTLPQIVLVLQLVILSYFVSALVLRFAFPSFSAEKNTAWIIATSPLPTGSLVWIKTAFYGLVFSVISGGAELVNAFVLHLSPQNSGILICMSILSAFFLTTCGIVLGASFPNFETDDPEQLSTSIPGLALVFGSIVYGALAAWVFYGYLITGSAAIIGVFAVIVIVTACIAIFKTTRAVAYLEFIAQK